MLKIYRTPAIALSFSENIVSDKIQLFRTGTFSHPEYGTFQVTPQMLAEVKKNFDAKVRGVDIALDYNHENEDIAAAWFKELILSEDGSQLFGRVEWTPKGKQVVQDKELRYVSPEINFAYRDNETLKDMGAVLIGAGLTNRPVIKKMEPVIQLSEIKYDENLQKQLEAEKLQKKNQGAKYMENDLSKLSPEELMKMVQELKGKLAALEADQAKTMAEKKTADKKSAFNKLLSEGKVCAAQEESYLKDDMTKFIELAQPVKLSESGNGRDKTTEVTGDVDDKIHKLAEEMIKEKKAKTLSEAYQMVMREKPELRKEKYGH